MAAGPSAAPAAPGIYMNPILTVNQAGIMRIFSGRETGRTRQMNDLSIAAILCPNGVGHFRRAVEVLAELSKKNPGLSFDIVCERLQR
jgi:uncharacterized membrane protein